MNSNQSTQNYLNIPIDKLMVWRNSWTKYDRKLSNMYLRIICDQLLITADTKILESFNMNQKLKGIYKEDVLILIVSSHNSEVRKLKFLIKANMAKCLEALSCYFPVMNHKISHSNKTINPKYKNINDVLKYAVEQKENYKGPAKLPTQFENFVKLCLLDPTFPQVVSETEQILKNFTLRK